VRVPPSTIPNRRPRNRSQRQLEESAENKASIVRAAATVFAERGYTQTTLDMVASLVGLSRQGVLHHFASKEALFHAVLEQEKRWAAGQLGPGPVTPSTGWAAIRELAGFLGQSPDARVPLQLVHVLEGEGISGNAAAHAYARERTELVRQNIRARLEQLRSDGEIAANADLDAAAVLVAATINGLQKRWLIDPGERTQRSFELLVDLLATQLAPRR
jgi:AcrR family transcriptional regulator